MLALAAWTGSMVLLYGPVLYKLAAQWQSDPTYSHGWVIAPVALVLAWRQRDRLREAPRQPSLLGLAIVVASLFIFILGTLGAELFLTRISLIGVLAGTVLFAFGRSQLRPLAFPLFFLFFMVPLPTIVFDRLAVSLQLGASAIGEQMLRAGGAAVLRDGNVLRLASVTLEVNEACSGIRSLMALLSVTTLVGYVWEPTLWRRVAVAALAVPLAIALNAVRIGVTGFAALRFGPWVAHGAIHEAAGAVVFVVAIACVTALHWHKQTPTLTTPRLEAA